ncbi:MAG TPA: ATP-binding protein, partial [Ktedonobacterales bacterium]|nr:ATP-binding protein [Ktedonobacterales bacterium]
LRELRADPRMSLVPIILLSARAGEEATAEGLLAGADDYVVKPFSTHELLVRIAARLEIANARREALVRSRELAGVIEAMPDGVGIFDPAGHIQHMNRAGRLLMGIADDADAARVFAQTAPERTRELDMRDQHGELLPPERLPQQRILRGEVLAGGDAVEVQVRTPQGAHVWWSITGAPLRDALGEISNSIVVFRDITERQRQERERAHMLSVVSHELKAPLTALKIRAQVLVRHAERGRVVAAHELKELDSDVRRMERLVNDLNDAARMENVLLELTHTRFDLSDLCQREAEEQMVATGRVVSLALPRGPVAVAGDIARIRQVLANLLSNALKYSPADRPVTVSLRRRGGQVRVAVVDQGPGIPAAALPNLFERFYRVPGVDVLHGSGVGLGLGLYISRALIDQHGGRMGVESTPGHGATFWFTLPLAAAPPQPHDTACG